MSSSILSSLTSLIPLEDLNSFIASVIKSELSIFQASLADFPKEDRKITEDQVLSKENRKISNEDSIMPKKDSIFLKEESEFSKEESELSKEESEFSKEESILSIKHSILPKEDQKSIPPSSKPSSEIPTITRWDKKTKQKLKEIKEKYPYKSYASIAKKYFPDQTTKKVANEYRKIVYNDKSGVRKVTLEDVYKFILLIERNIDWNVIFKDLLPNVNRQCAYGKLRCLLKHFADEHRTQYLDNQSNNECKIDIRFKGIKLSQEFIESIFVIKKEQLLQYLPLLKAKIETELKCSVLDKLNDEILDLLKKHFHSNSDSFNLITSVLYKNKQVVNS